MIEKLFEDIKSHGLGKLIDLIGNMAELGYQAALEDAASHSKEPESQRDPMLTPSEAAKYLGISVKTLAQNWQIKYQIQHSGHAGKDRRYLLSELERVKKVHFETGKGKENGKPI